jgi:hypothetical protein
MTRGQISKPTGGLYLHPHSRSASNTVALAASIISFRKAASALPPAALRITRPWGCLAAVALLSRVGIVQIPN